MSDDPQRPDDSRPDAPEPADRPIWEPSDDAPAEGSASASDDTGSFRFDGPAFVPEPADEEPPSRRGKLVRRVVLGVVGLVAALYVAGYFLTGMRLPADATIGGVDVGGKSPAAAQTALEDALGPKADQPVTLVHDDKEFVVEPDKAGIALDAAGSVEAAGGDRSWNPADMLALVTGGTDHDLVLTVDDDTLDSAVKTVAESVDVPVTEALITFRDGKPKARSPKAGVVVPRDRARAAIESSYLVTEEKVEVPTEPVDPAVDQDGLDEAVRTIAEPAVSGPVRIRVGDKAVSLPVSAYSPALTVEVVDGAMKAVLDEKKLAKPLTDSTTGIGKKAVDATVEIRDGKPRVVPGKEGVGLQPKEMAQKLAPVLDKTGDARTVSVEAKVVEPEFTTQDAKDLKITERISEFSTYFPYAEYRNVNQGRAAELIDGTLIKPGETFSFNDIVGERTEANGFTTGTVINGGVFREELGGGVSQVATTTYNAAFFGGMDDVEHHPHAFYIDRYPVGREATVYFGNLDLRWKNSTKYGVLVRSYVNRSTPSSRGEMHVELWSTKIYDVKAGQSGKRNYRSPGTQYDDTSACVPQAPIQGFDIDIYRTFYRDGQKVKSETDTATYQAADNVICGPKPSEKKNDDEDD